MSTFNFNPRFDRISNSITFNTNELNHLVQEQVFDHSQWWQSNYQPYGIMRINKDMKHVLHYLTIDNPFIAQALKNCRVDPAGQLSPRKKEIEPCKGVMMTEICDDELLDSCFKSFHTFANGRRTLDADGRRFFGQVYAKFAEMMVKSVRMITWGGQYYDLSQDVFLDTVPADKIADAVRTLDTCRGLLATIRDYAASGEYNNLDVAGLFETGDFNGHDFVGKVVDLADRLYDGSTPQMQYIVDQGSITTGQGDSLELIFLASRSIIKKLAQEWRTQCDDPFCKNPRLTMEVKGRTKVYHIDGVPVVPMTDLDEIESLMTVRTHFLGLTVSRNLLAGTSYGRVPSVGDNVGVYVSRETKASELGITQYRSDFLVSAEIAAPELLTFGSIQTQK